MILEDLGSDKTEMILQVGFSDDLSEDEVQNWLSMGMFDGWNQTLDRLGPYLATILAGS